MNIAVKCINSLSKININSTRHEWLFQNLSIQNTWFLNLSTSGSLPYLSIGSRVKNKISNSSLVPQAFCNSSWTCGVTTRISDTIIAGVIRNWSILCRRIYANLLIEIHTLRGKSEITNSTIHHSSNYVILLKCARNFRYQVPAKF